MLIDAKMVFCEDEPIVTGAAEGTLDLYATDIPIYPDSNLRKNHGRGSGSAVMVHGVVSPDPADGAALGGYVVANLYIGDNATPTSLAATWQWETDDAGISYWKDNAGIHFVAAMPYDSEGRYARIVLDTTNVTGLGTAPTFTSFLFAQ